MPTRTRHSLVCLLVLILGLCVMSGCRSKRISLQEVESSIRQRIPLGASDSLVVAILDEMKIEHSAFDQGKQSIQAIVRSTARSATTTTSVQVIFAFNPDRRLADYTFREVLTGP